MASRTIKCVLRSRIDTTANWNSTNPILADGEIGIEKLTDGKKLVKVGDGTTNWASLQYISSFGYLPLSGGTMTGAVNMGSNKITNVGTPTVSSDVATKQYVDDNAGSKSYRTTITNNGTTQTITHNLNTINIIVQAFTSDSKPAWIEYTISSVNTISIITGNQGGTTAILIAGF